MLREKFENLVLRDQLGNPLPLFDLGPKFEFVVRGEKRENHFQQLKSRLNLEF